MLTAAIYGLVTCLGVAVAVLASWVWYLLDVTDRQAELIAKQTALVREQNAALAGLSTMLRDGLGTTDIRA